MASKKRKEKPREGITSASEILYRRYVKGKPERQRSLTNVSVAMSLGEYIRELRERKEVTQQQLADAIGTQRSAISRLESADYDGHSIELLRRIAKALQGKLIFRIATENDPKEDRELILA